VQVRGGGIEASLHAQRATTLQALAQFIQLEDFIGSAADQGKGFINGGHAKTPGFAVKNMNGVKCKLTTPADRKAIWLNGLTRY
jgi:predicted transcriptional regulator